MEARRETKPSMLRRCLGWDYRQPGIYQITLVLADRRSQALGRLVIPGASAPGTGQAAASAPGMQSGPCPVLEAEASRVRQAASSFIALSPAGEAVMREWRNIAAFHPEAKPLFMQVMPDHVHFILQITRPLAKPLGNLVGGFKAGSSKAAIGRPGLWAEGFQDTILFHEGQLDSMFRYLRDNPRRLAVKSLLPDLFKVRRNLAIPLFPSRPVPVAEAPACSVLGAEAPACPVPGAGAPGLFFSAVGNHFLLDAPVRLQVQCSRSIFAYRRVAKAGGGRKIERDAHGAPVAAFSTPEFEEKRDSLLAAARHGAVLVSPCISDGEREIARLAFAAGASVVALKNMGFPPLSKPQGRLFDLTADGRLLLLAPAAWPYQTAEKPMTRLDACVLNRIAQLLAGPGAAEISNKGMKPNDIDRLVVAAVGTSQK